MVLVAGVLVGLLAVYHRQRLHGDAHPNMPHGLRQARDRTVVMLAKGLAEWVSPSRSLHSLARDLTNQVDLAELRSWAKAIKFPEEDGMKDLPATEWSKALNFADRQPSWVLVMHRTNGADYVIAEYAGSFGFEGIHIQVRGPEPQSSQKITFLKIAEGIYGYSQP